jgi:hypothetical protein
VGEGSGEGGGGGQVPVMAGAEVGAFVVEHGRELVGAEQVDGGAGDDDVRAASG